MELAWHLKWERSAALERNQVVFNPTRIRDKAALALNFLQYLLKAQTGWAKNCLSEAVRKLTEHGSVPGRRWPVAGR